MKRLTKIAVIATGLFAGGVLLNLDSKNTPTEADADRARTLLPEDSTLRDAYTTSCMGCHITPATGAPLTGFSPDWQERLNERGSTEALLESAIYGYRNMPALGYCFECTDEELLQLVLFMSGLEPAAADTLADKPAEPKP